MRKREKRDCEEDKRRETVPWVFNRFENFWEGDFGILMLVEREESDRVREEMNGTEIMPFHEGDM